MRQPTFARSDDALWQRTSRRTLINPAAGGDTFELRSIAALVWEALAEPVTLSDLVDDLAAVFDQPSTRVLDEVEQLLGDLVTRGAVRTR